MLITAARETNVDQNRTHFAGKKFLQNRSVDFESNPPLGFRSVKAEEDKCTMIR